MISVWASEFDLFMIPVPNWRGAQQACALRNVFKFETLRASYAYDFRVCEFSFLVSRIFGVVPFELSVNCVTVWWYFRRLNEPGF